MSVTDFFNSDDRTPEGSKNVIIMLLVTFVALFIIASFIKTSDSGQADYYLYDNEPPCLPPQEIAGC